MKNFQFSEYFKFYQYGQWQPAPIVKIDKKSQYVVKEFYLDQFDPNMVSQFVNLKEPNIPEEMYKFTLMLISTFKNDKGSILVFLPGIFEIGRLRSHLVEHADA